MNRVLSFGVLAWLSILLMSPTTWAVAKESKATPAGPRSVEVLEYLSFAPLFVTDADTLDPTEVARVSWDGWMKHRGVPWGSLIGGAPTIRLSFDCRALPWPSIKQHHVDGPDNNMRCLAAHAALHDMFPLEKKGDRIEEGHVGYLLFCSDSISGLPYTPDSMNRRCSVGHGEFTKNLILMYEYSGVEWYKDWAAKALAGMRHYAIVEQLPGIGMIAWYPLGMFTPGQEPVGKTANADTNLGGLQSQAVGWNVWAYAKWYEQTGDEEALKFAVALANRLFNGRDPNGNDGSFRPDGSFGGNSQSCTHSWHVHTKTHCLPGLVLLGQQLILANRVEDGRDLIDKSATIFDWLYDPAHNPDAGSMTGWLGEWLMVATGWERQADCEGCTMGDIVEAATALGAASRLDPSLSDYVKYYDRAEQIFRGQCIEQMFTLRDDYRAVLKDCLRQQIETERKQKLQAEDGENVTTSAEKEEPEAEELKRRYQSALLTAERMVGQQLGICGFPDWVNKLPSDLNPELPGIHMQGCCADATVRAAHAIWKETITGNVDEARVNLAFNRSSDLADVVSCLPHRGEINILVKTARKVMVRVPEWTHKEKVKAFVDRQSVPVTWQGSYAVFDATKAGQQLTVTYPLRVAEVKETPGSLDGTTYTEKWRGNTIVDIHPRGKWVPMFVRPELDTELVP